jgi:predicted dienelactone hydrolase
MQLTCKKDFAMRIGSVTLILILALISQSSCALAQAVYIPDANGVEVAILEGTWKDGQRNREVPFKIYYPKSATGKLPIIIFSHGLGGSREGYSYLGKYWAAHGYVSVHLTHHGSDTEAVANAPGETLRERAGPLATDPMNAINRCVDVKFAIDELTDESGDDKFPLKDRLDLSSIGMAGHSFGANTTMLVSGELTRTGRSFTEDRIKCAIALSPPIAVPKAMYDKVYANVGIPLFDVTGTKDDSPIGETMAPDRRVPFDHVVNIPAYLITFEGATHMTFAGPRRNLAASDLDLHVQKLVQQGTTAFWDAYLRNDASAKAWFTGGGFAKLVDKTGVFEQKEQKAK